MAFDFPMDVQAPEWDVILSASQKNDADEVVRLLNEEGIPPSHSNVVGQTALHIAALWGSVEAMEALILAGADVNAQNQIAKMTPLHCAIRGTFQSFQETHERRVQCVRLLLRAGADAAICDMKGKDAFGCIDVAVREAGVRQAGANVEEEMEEMRRVLKTCGASASELGRCIDEMDAEGVGRCLGGGDAPAPTEVEKGLLTAAEKFKDLLDEGSADGRRYESIGRIMKLLLDAGADANAHPPVSSTPSPLSEAPLHLVSSGLCSAYSTSPASASAAANSAADVARDLLAHGAKVCSATMALLPGAAHRGKVESVKFLIDAVGVDPNYRWRQGMTGLILASRSGKVDVVRSLLEYDALDLGVTDDAGKSAMDYATANGKAEIVELLGRRG